MKKTVAYIRVSTLEQAKDGYSIKAQEEKIRAYSKAKDLDLIDIYIDDGYTGSNLDRPAIKRMLSSLNNIDCVLVYKLDRLSRSQKEILYLVEDVFMKRDIDFISINETFDTSTAYGRAMIGMLAVFSQLERENIIQRTVLGKEQRAKEGYFAGGTPPLGYSYHSDSLIPNTSEISIVDKIYSHYISGYGLNAISKKLYNEGHRGKNGGRISASKIRRILSNPIYAGYIAYGDSLYKGKHVPIIAKSDFDTVQEIIRYKRSIGDYKRSRDDTHIFSGLLYCGICSARIFKRSMNRRDYYTCYSYHGSPAHMVKSTHCNLGLLDKGYVDNYILNSLLSIPPASFIEHRDIGFEIDDMRPIWNEATDLERRSIVLGLIDSIILYQDKIEISYSIQT